MNPLRLLLSMLLLVSLAGCAGAALPYTSMSPEQIEALARIKDASLGCVSGIYAGAKVTTVIVNVDRGIPAGVTIDGECRTTFSMTPMERPGPPVAPR